MVRDLLPQRFTILESIEGGISLKLRPKRGRNQQGLCFVSTDLFDSTTSAFQLSCKSNSVISDVRASPKVPKDVIILDARVFDQLACCEEDEVELVPEKSEIPVCTEIHLGVVSRRGLDNHTVAQAISKRIDDFQEYFDGLILGVGQEISLSELGVSLVIKSMSPIEPTRNAARIDWNRLIKIHLKAIESKPSNLCFIVEVSAATQIKDVQVDAAEDAHITRHQAILESLESIEERLQPEQIEKFAGIIFSDKLIPFITFDSQTGEETQITNLHSASLIGSFRVFLEGTTSEFSQKPSNPGLALNQGLDTASLLNEANGLVTIVVFFSSGVYSAGQNPVKITRQAMTNRPVKILCISVGENSATDIMEAVAKEGNGFAIQLDNVQKTSSIADAIAEIANIPG
jgi:hypothetical protein